ncbi:hypothetical protein [Nostocoides sp. Soil756]|jgi:hypothetical protein|uniref:hypothetical protein n=1 Tax=Nostocoides sp. Soil756 TaxID=1736399 RepID=UPI0006FC5068|nr:hypothetical protein [Tetrasphaera sp. Soil756]KRE62427.1 hypothetical protein ASG78_05200 [Tetrasphaera sp. Soil756]
MIPATTWRRLAAGAVVTTDVLVLLVAMAELPGALKIAGPLLVGATVWALLAPASWGALVLLALQALVLATSRTVPASVTDWSLAALGATLLLVTHLALSLLAAWPPGAALPGPTAARWARQTGVLATLGGIGAALGLAASRTPVGWGPWLGALALLAVAGTAFVLRAVAGRRA